MTARSSEPSGSSARGERPVNPIIVAGLASGQTHEQIAEVANCSPRTVRREAARSEVRTAVAEEQARMATSAAGRFAALLDRAITVVADAFRDDDAAVRLRAAEMVFRQFLRFGEHVDLRAQVQKLRAELDARTGSRPSDAGDAT
jgi:hypothetical protein